MYILCVVKTPFSQKLSVLDAMSSSAHGSEEVRAVVQRVHESGAEARARRRLEAQTRGRKIDLSEYQVEVGDREKKNLINFCKSGKISATQLKR